MVGKKLTVLVYWRMLNFKLNKNFCCTFTKNIYQEHFFYWRRFGVHNSTMYKCVQQFVKPIFEVLLPMHIKMPDMGKTIHNAWVFNGMHIHILPPADRLYQ